MFKKLLSYFTLYCVIITQTASLAFAQLSITPDGSTPTQVTHTASGIDQVNIAAPNASGISHNNFTDYNVNQSGQVINNFSGQVASEVAGGSGVTAVTQTQIGGLVTVNQNLSSSGSARIILNEVTSTNNSQLLGYAEIAGTKAELIIANPNGITCSGCGFINTSRLSLIAGTSAYDPSGNLNFNLKEPANLQIPLITIQGLGLDVERTSYTDIIASSIKLIGNIYGSDNTDVTLKAADGKFDYSTKNITNYTTQNSELFAIDATNLGGIQAGRIFIIATKDGFGVNLDNSLIASKEMQIDVRGNIFYTNIQAPTASLKSTKNITHKENGIMLANSVNIEARDFTTNSGALTKSLLDDINISARIFSNSGNIISAKNLNIGATSLTNSGILNAAEKITITASEDILNEGIIGSFAVQNPDSSFTNFITKEIQITARNLNNKNLIYANDDISFTLTNFLTNSANIISAKDLRATAKNFKNDSGLIQATRNLSITKSGTAEIGATSFSNNDGNFLSGSSFDINFGANDYIINGTISSDEITISAANIINNSDVEASASITLSATNDITNNSGASFVAGSFFDATATNDITNYGLISATTDTNLTAKNLNNFDRIFAGSDLETAITNNLTNNTNSLIGAGNNLTLKVDNNLLNDRGASILAIADIEIKSNAGGKISNFTNNSALLESIEGDIVINAVDFYNKRDAQDFGVMEIVKTDANKTWYENEQKYYEHGEFGSGPIYGGGGPGWSGVRLENLGLHYTIWDYAWGVARYDAYIEQITQIRRTEGTENKSSMIRAAGDITVNATNFNNHSSEIISLNDLTVNAVNFNNKSQGIMDTVRHYCGAGAGSCMAYKIITDPNSGAISYQLMASLGWNVWYPDSYYEFDAIGSFFAAALKAKNNLNLNVSNIINNGQAQGTQTVDHNLPTTQTEFTQDSAYVSPVITQLKETGSLNILGNVTKTATALFNKSTNPNVPLYETRAEFIDQNQFLGSDYFFNAIGYSPPATSRLIGDNFFMQKLIESQLNDILKTSTALSSSSFALYSDNIQELMDNAAQMKQDLSLAPGISLSAASIAALTKDIVWIEAVTLADGTVVLAPKVYLSQATRDQLKLNEGEILGAKNINITGNSASTILNNSGSIVASNNLSITGISALNNQGRSTYNRNSLIESGNNLTLSTNNNLLNFGTIKATGATSNLTLTSLNGNITNNNSSTINSTNALTINALNGTLLNKSAIEASGALAINARDIKNISTVYTNDANLLEENSDAYQLRFDSESGVSSGNIYSVLHETASMKGGSVALSATNDFTNLGAEISATKNNVGGALTSGNVSITADNDINISTLQLRNRTESNWGNGRKGGTSVTDTTTNIASDFSVDGNLILDAGNNAKIKGSDITVAGNADISTGGNLTIQSAEDTYYHQESANKKGSSDRAGSSSLTVERLSNRESNIIVGGSLSSNSQGNINIIASNLTSTGGDINLTAVKAVNILSAADTYLRDEQSSKKGTTVMKSSINLQQDLVHVKSDLNAANNINITSGTNTNLIGTNLTSTNNISINAGGEIGIYAVEDQHYKYRDSTKARSFATIAKYSGLSVAMDAIDKTTTFLDSIDPGTYLGINPTGSLVQSLNSYTQNLTEGNFSYKFNAKTIHDITNQKAELTAGNDISLIADTDINLEGVELDAVNNGTISSTNGDVNIANVKDSHYERSESQSSRITVVSLITDQIRNFFLSASNLLVAPDLSKNYEKKKDIMDENSEGMKTASKKQETHIKEITDETIIASNLNFKNLTINSTNTSITSSNINASNDLTINSSDSTTITTDAENDSTFTLDEKKSPSILAAIGNGIVKLVKDTFPDATPFEKSEKKDKQEKEQRENDSMGHQAHRVDFSTETKTDNAMLNGYTISNDDADEMAYDTDLNKVTSRTKSNVASNIFANNDIAINSTNGNNLIVGSKITAGNDLNINSTNGTTVITSAKDESFLASSTVYQDYNDISLEYNRGRASINSRSSVEEEDSKTTKVTQVSSQLMSGNNININTKDDISILSSNLSSNNQINLNSTNGNINILTNDNTTHFEKEIRSGTMELSVGINNVVLDAAYALDDTVKAAEALKAAKENLSKMKDLKKEGKATSEAVEDAEINLQIANLNLALAVMKAAAAAEKTENTAETWGFYFDLKLTRSGDKTNITTNALDEVASSLLANNTILITSGSALTTTEAKNNDSGNTNIKGSIISNNGDITITSKNDTNITALKSTSSSSMKSEGFTQTVTLGASYGESSAQTVMESLMAQISVRSSKSQADNVNYTNTILSAENGNLTINSFDDANIKGSDLFAQNIILNTQNNLNIESLQNKNHSKSKSTSVGAGGGSNSVSLSYNASRSKFDRDWVDDQTSVIGTDSVTINTGNNTNLAGAVIANITNATKGDLIGDAKANQKAWIDGGNLTLNTKSLTYSDIFDTEKQQSSAVGIAISPRFNNNSDNDENSGNENNIQTNPNSNNPGQDGNYYPKGSLSLSLQNEGYEKNQTTKATIGQGNITTNATIAFDANGNAISSTGGTTNDPLTLANLNRDVTKTQEITKDTITGALNVNTTIDLRLLDLSCRGQREIFEEVKDLPENIGANIKLGSLIIDESLELIGRTPLVGEMARQITSPVEGLIDYFYENDSSVIDRNGNIVSAASRRNYLVNGVGNDEKSVKELLNEKNVDAVGRVNPTSGLLGDLIESALGKTLGRWLPGTSEMAVLVAGDIHDRKDLGSGNSVFHSQGSIIGDNAMRYYDRNYDVSGVDKISPKQLFVAVGPAVSQEDWGSTTSLINVKNDYNHDINDPVKYLTSPSNLINDLTNPIQAVFGRQDMSPYILPNPIDWAQGIYYGAKSPSSHVLKNPQYIKYLQSSQ